MQTYVKGEYTILGTFYTEDEDQIYTFSVPVDSGKAVQVVIMPSEKKVEAFSERDFSDELLNVLETGIYDASKMKSTLRIELHKAIGILTMATKKLLIAMKYAFNLDDLSEQPFSIKDEYWSADKENWRVVPKSIAAIMDIKQIIFLNENTAKYMQNYINKGGWEPFLALRHLHRAKKESNPRFKWIDATIAAELAIKECLIRIKPDIETILLEMPSPPLHKLYGIVLESFGKERSPKVKEIAKGVEIRNKLVHRPNEIDLDHGEANIYVQDIEIAIFHLLSLIYPNDPVIEHFSNPKVLMSNG